MSLGLSRVSDADLASLLRMLESGELTAPLVSAALSARGLGTSTLQPYAELDSKSLRAVIEAVLCERQNRQSPKLTLVWTGDDPRRVQLLSSVGFTRPWGSCARLLFARGSASIRPSHRLNAGRAA